MFSICAVIGAMLGFRFKVTVLVPSIVVATFGSGAVEAALGANSLAIVGAMIINVIAVQFGYLIGIGAYGTQANIKRKLVNYGSRIW